MAPLIIITSTLIIIVILLNRHYSLWNLAVVHFGVRLLVETLPAELVQEALQGCLERAVGASDYAPPGWLGGPPYTCCKHGCTSRAVGASDYAPAGWLGGPPYTCCKHGYTCSEGKYTPYHCTCGITLSSSGGTRSLALVAPPSSSWPVLQTRWP